MKIDGRELAKRMAKMHKKTSEYDDEGEEMVTEIGQKLDCPDRFYQMIKSMKSGDHEDAHSHFRKYLEEEYGMKKKSKMKGKDSEEDYGE